ncbi:MAG: rhodanese-like domain-containing protein [Filomicrobium sp.]
MAVKIGVKQLVAEASKRIETVEPDAAQSLLNDPDTVFVDIRDVRELEREGMIPGAFHAPRGMLEFWVDPESPYHKDVFSSGKRFVLYCQSSWRSALATATLVDMGLERVCHVGGGFAAWKKSGAPTAERASKSEQ